MTISAAHQRSAFAVIDPAYSIDELMPPKPVQPVWLYPRAEYECFMLQKMREDVKVAKLRVGYPGCFHTPCAKVYFRRKVRRGELEISINGAVRSFLNGEVLNNYCEIPCDGMLLLEIEVGDVTAGLPALASELEGWEASIDGVEYTRAVPGGLPTGDELPQMAVTLNNYAPCCYDAGREILAWVEVRAVAKPEFGFGESLFELENRDPELSEQNLELVEKAPGIWGSPTLLAFRYLRVKGEGIEGVNCRAAFTPARYRGAFAADPELTRIWMCSAYTLRLCLYHFQIDGIKRDRLPWVGDLALSLLANAYVFGDPEPVRRTLTVLGRAGIREKHLNGIVDYSLWYLICHDLFQLYWDDKEFLELQYAEIKDLVHVLFEQSGDELFLPPGTWLFIDWVEGEKMTALQILYYWALNAAARLAGRMDDLELACNCRDYARRLQGKIMATAYDRDKGLFFAGPGNPASGFTRHPNFLAILAGVVSGEQVRAVAEALAGTEMAPVGTPYQASLEILALYRAGKAENAIERLRKLWGGMLAMGATTFFEAYDEAKQGDEHYSFYRRPYGLSLCHAWSAGPAALLPIIFFGAEPTGDGWSDYKIDKLADMPRDAAVSIPTPNGEILLES